MKLLVARHAECEKNLVGIPGGPGAALTPTGRLEAELLAENIRSFDRLPDQVIACPTAQTIETAQILATALDVPMTIGDELKSIHLGVLAGVPIVEARRLYPTSSKSMDEWRAGEIELCDVDIDGMEDPRSFYGRGIHYLLECTGEQRVNLIVATTSILILLQNLFDMKGPERGEGYRVRHYENAQLIELNFSPTQIDWLKQQAERYEGI
ncbi:histidine phosphatase family protein [Bradyrhizobium amphicarpaeae]|uniref:histidine phosphatase family protein n=1 Tax=Bradyrhizobium amphicarpaeae TaxID=1404768 RepID=UPI0013903A15|nr:histidine phosphatase family protein [Bradyrhizobium amphicarpaeae]